MVGSIGVLIGVAAALTIAIFFIKLRWFALLPAAFWVILANFMLGTANVKDWSDIDWNTGYLFYAFAVFCFACILMLNKPIKDKVDTPIKDTRESWEINDEALEKRMKYIRRYSPKPKAKNIYKNPYDDSE
jgi:hypothetical protein